MEGLASQLGHQKFSSAEFAFGASFEMYRPSKLLGLNDGLQMLFLQ